MNETAVAFWLVLALLAVYGVGFGSGYYIRGQEMKQKTAKKVDLKKARKRTALYLRPGPKKKRR